jgi:hypothetical protein
MRPLYAVRPRDEGFGVVNLNIGFRVGPKFARREDADKYFETSDGPTDKDRENASQAIIQDEVDKSLETFPAKQKTIRPKKS